MLLFFRFKLNILIFWELISYTCNFLSYLETENSSKDHYCFFPSKRKENTCQTPNFEPSTATNCEQSWERLKFPKLPRLRKCPALPYQDDKYSSHILLYSGVSTYVGLYGSGLFNFRSYINLPTLFACFLGFDVPKSSSSFIENVFIIVVIIELAWRITLLMRWGD